MIFRVLGMYDISTVFHIRKCMTSHMQGTDYMKGNLTEIPCTNPVVTKVQEISLFALCVSCRPCYYINNGIYRPHAQILHWLFPGRETGNLFAVALLDSHPPFSKK